MTPNRQQVLGAWERPRARHYIAALVAAVSSILLHAFVIRAIPPLHIGRPPSTPLIQRIQPVQLGTVDRRLHRGLDRPERFRPTDPDHMTLAAAEPSEFRELVQQLIPDEPADPGVDLAGETAPLVKPDPVVERERWDPRQDIVHIRDTIVPDEIAALPRRYISPEDRVDRAPDITLPAERPAEGRDRTLAHYAADERPGFRDGGLIPAGALASVRPGDSIIDSLPDHDVLEEIHEDITDVAAIENLLILDVTTYAASDNDPSVYFQAQIRRAGAEALPVLPKDVLFVQDCSASMGQRFLEQCKQGLLQNLDRLNPSDRFEIVSFRERTRLCFNELAEVNSTTRARANWFIQDMRAQGDTDVFEGLRPLLSLEVDPARPVIAVLVTDGVPTTGVVDSSDIIEQFSSANAGRVSVFTLGGGPRVNQYLLDFLSYKNRGDVKLVAERHMVPDALAELAAELSRPVLADLRCRVAGSAEADVYPRSLTHLFLDRPLVLYGRAPRDSGPIAMQVLGHSLGERKDMVFTLDLSEAPAGDASIRTLWAWQKIYHLVGEHIRSRDRAILDQIHAMADEYGLRVLYGRETVPMTF